MRTLAIVLVCVCTASAVSAVSNGNIPATKKEYLDSLKNAQTREESAKEIISSEQARIGELTKKLQEAEEHLPVIKEQAFAASKLSAQDTTLFINDATFLYNEFTRFEPMTSVELKKSINALKKIESRLETMKTRPALVWSSMVPYLTKIEDLDKKIRSTMVGSK